MTYQWFLLIEGFFQVSNMLQFTEEASSVFPTRANENNSKKGFVAISGSSLFIKRFPKSWDEEKIAERFGLYGVIYAIYLPRDEAGISKQWALVDFSSSAEADRAKIAMHNFYIDEKSQKDLPLYVSYAQKKADREQALKKKLGNAYDPKYKPKHKLSILLPQDSSVPVHEDDTSYSTQNTPKSCCTLCKCCRGFGCEECRGGDPISPRTPCSDHAPEDWLYCDRCSYDPYDQWGSPGGPEACW